MKVEGKLLVPGEVHMFDEMDDETVADPLRKALHGSKGERVKIDPPVEMDIGALRVLATEARLDGDVVVLTDCVVVSIDIVESMRLTAEARGMIVLRKAREGED